MFLCVCESLNPPTKSYSITKHYRACAVHQTNMSGPSGERRRDGKLESFLSRALPGEDYERLLARQSAVAVMVVAGRAGKPAHRHAVVGHGELYLIDVPPRHVREAVQLRDVESVQIVSMNSCIVFSRRHKEREDSENVTFSPTHLLQL